MKNLLNSAIAVLGIAGASVVFGDGVESLPTNTVLNVYSFKASMVVPVEKEVKSGDNYLIAKGKALTGFVLASTNYTAALVWLSGGDTAYFLTPTYSSTNGGAVVAWVDAALFGKSYTKSEGQITLVQNGIDGYFYLGGAMFGAATSDGTVASLSGRGTITLNEDLALTEDSSSFANGYGTYNTGYTTVSLRLNKAISKLATGAAQKAAILKKLPSKVEYIVEGVDYTDRATWSE